MEAEYEFTIDDAQAFSEYLFDNSPVYKKQMKSISNRFLFIPGVLILGTVFFIFSKDTTAAVVFGLAGAILAVFYFFLPGLLRKRLLKTAYKQHQQRLPAEKRKQKISINKDGLTQTTAESTQTFIWSMVDDVITFKQYMFITIRGSGVISVPQRAFANQAGFQQFIAEVKMDWQKGKTKFAE